MSRAFVTTSITRAREIPNEDNENGAVGRTGSEKLVSGCFG